MTDTDVIQTPSDRFHRWLLNMSLLIQEYRIGELMVWNEDLTALLAQPTDSALKLHVTKASTWVGLLYEFNLLQSAFTRMLLSDQATAVDRFEVDKLLKYHRNDDNELVPVEVEMSGLPALGVNAEVAGQIRFSVFWKISIFSCRICKIVKHYQQNKVPQLNSCNSISKQFDFVLAQAADSPEPI